MEAPVRQGWASSVRTVVFALMAAVVLLGVVIGEQGSPTSPLEPDKAALLTRGGDNVMRAYYLVAVGGGSTATKEAFLGWASDLYEAALEADPSDFQRALSAAIVARELGVKTEATSLLPRLGTRQFEERSKRTIGAVYALVLTSYPSLEAVERSRDYLSRMAPGPLLTASGYLGNEKPELAEETLREAAGRARPVARRFLVAAIADSLVVLAGLVLLLSLLRRRRPAPEAGTTGFPMSARWGTREAVEALVLWAFSLVVLAGLAGSASTLSGPPPAYMIIGPTIAAALAAVGWVWLVARCRAGLGWELSNWLRLTALGIAAAGLATLPVLGAHAFLQRLLGQSTADSPVLSLLVVPDTTLAKVGLLLGIGFAIPALEETLFRGVLFGGLRRQWSFWPAALVSAGVFAVVHMDLAGFLVYALLGLLFAYLFERSRSLVASWAAHAAFNVFNLMLLFALFG